MSFSHWIFSTLSPVDCTHSHNHPLWTIVEPSQSQVSSFREMQNIAIFFSVLGKTWKSLIKNLFLLTHIFIPTWTITFTSCKYRSCVELWIIALVSPTFTVVFLLQTIFLFCFTGLCISIAGFSPTVYEFKEVREFWDTVEELCCQ